MYVTSLSTEYDLYNTGREKEKEVQLYWKRVRGLWIDREYA